MSKTNTLDINEIQDRINLVNPHIKIVSYNGIRERASFYCAKHKANFDKICSVMLGFKSGCEKCFVENTRDNMGMGLDEFKRRLFNVQPELVVLGDYINNSTPIKVFCTKHNYIYSSSPCDLLKRKTCCDKTKASYKEEQVCRLIEEEWGFKIKRQKVFKDCRDKNPLPFDIYLEDHNILIEYQGEQHYRPVKFRSETMADAILKFEYTKKNMIKLNISIAKNIIFL